MGDCDKEKDNPGDAKLKQSRRPVWKAKDQGLRQDLVMGAHVVDHSDSLANESGGNSSHQLVANAAKLSKNVGVSTAGEVVLQKSSMINRPSESLLDGDAEDNVT